MAELNVDLNRYCHEVKKWLPCSGDNKHRIVSQIRDQVLHFLDENPGADFIQIQERFGTPQQIAAAAVNEMDTCQLLEDLRLRRRLVSIIAAGLAVIGLAWCVFVSYTMVNNELMQGTTYSICGKVLAFDNEENRWIFGD